MRPGVRIGVDPGDARVGIARSDPAGILATPVETASHGAAVTRIAALVVDHDALEVVIGLPRSLSGSEGPAARKARRFATRVARRVDPVPVRMWDERLTTVSAEAMLRELGHAGQRRRAVVDQAAAVLILQHALDHEKGTGAIPGELVNTSHTDHDTDERPPIDERAALDE